MFQVLNGLLLRELPVASPQELVEINLPEADLVRARGNFPRWPAMPYPLYEELRRRQEAFSTVFAWADEWFNLAPAGEVRRAPGLWVSGDYFPVLGLTPALGRLFTPADDRPGCGFPGAVVSHDFWQRELGGDRHAIGRTLNVHSRQVDIIGVAPAGFTGLQVGHTFDVALPICSLVAFRPDSTQLTTSTQWWITAVGRLKPGWTVERADAHLRAIAPGVFKATLPPDYPRSERRGLSRLDVHRDAGGDWPLVPARGIRDAPAPAARDDGLRAAHRLRQPHDADARTRRRAAARAVAAPGAGRLAGAAPVAAPGREHRHRHGQRGRRRAGGVRAEPGPGAADRHRPQPDRARADAGLARRHLPRAHRVRHLPDPRRGPGGAGVARQPRRRAEERRPLGGRRRRRPAVTARARGRAGRCVAGPRRGRVPVRAQLRQPARRGARLPHRSASSSSRRACRPRRRRSRRPRP